MDDWGIHGQREAVERSSVPIQSWGSWMDAGTANGVIHQTLVADCALVAAGLE